MSVPSKVEMRLVDVGKIRAFVDLHYGDFVIKGFKVVEPPDKPAFVAMPSKQIPAKDDDGQPIQKWISMIWMPDAGRKKAFEEHILKLYRQMLREAGAGKRVTAA